MDNFTDLKCNDKSTGLPSGWKKEVRRHGIGDERCCTSGKCQCFYIIVTHPGGFVFNRKSQFRKFCEVWPIPTMGINPDEVFRYESIPEKTKTS